MSEFQYYEFQALDRPLTQKEQQEVSALSSRAKPHPRQAIFTYSWSGFPAEEAEILAKYFDAFFYIANWGSVALGFRLPLDTVDWPLLQQYEYEAVVEIARHGDYVTITIRQHELEQGYWIEGEGILETLLPIRAELLRGDYRFLYLGWLAAIQMDIEENEAWEEPPVPAGLNNLSPALKSFSEIFDLNQHTIRAAAQGSGPLVGVDQSKLLTQVEQLPAEQMVIWLKRLLTNDDPQLALKFRHMLAGPITTSTRPGQRLASQILLEAEMLAREAKAREAAAARIAYEQRMADLASQADALWQEVETYSKMKNPKGYDEATRILVQLGELAEFEGETAIFEHRVSQLRQQFGRLPSLLRRWQEAGLV